MHAIYQTVLWILEKLINVFDHIKTLIHFRNDKIRCTHTSSTNEHHQEILDKNNEIMKNLKIGRVIGDSNLEIDLEKETVTINIPLVFYLLDPKLSKSDWTTHINSEIIKQLNIDFNRGYDNYYSALDKKTRELFANAETIKKEHYTKLSGVLSKYKNINWNFFLKSIKTNPISGLYIEMNDSDRIFNSVEIEDPESNLNMIVVPGSSILGISIFPFWDRDINDESKIDPKYKYRNAILINTDIFLGNYYPFDQYRTFTHEIGHWAGLLHTFDNESYRDAEVRYYGLDKLNLDNTPVQIGEQDQDFVGDLIADTTPQYEPTYGTVYDVVRYYWRWISGKYYPIKYHSGPYANIFKNNNFFPNFFNFMDYTDDAQMCMFTQLQMVKMIYMMARFRPNFVSRKTI